MRNDWGLNYVEKNRIRRLAEAGHDPQAIAVDVKCEPHLVMNYLSTLGDPEPTAPVEDNPDYDGYGPMPGTADWNKLSPGARGGLTRKRNNARIQHGSSA